MRPHSLFVSMMVLTLAASHGAGAASPQDPIAPLAASADISFASGAAVLTPDSVKRLRPVVGQAKSPACYWIASGRDEGEAEMLKAALAEYDIDVARIVALVTPQAASAEVRLYCTPPARVSAYFMPRTATLTDAAKRLLAIAVAGYWGTSTGLVVRGYAGPEEGGDPLQLGLDRAQAVRSYLMAQGLAPKRLTIEANTQAKGDQALRVDVMPGGG